MYESKRSAPIGRATFLRRILIHFGIVVLLFVFSLAIGMAGYAHFEQLSWLDAFLNSSMLLGGMGPVNAPQTDGGKLFAGMYALYSGLVFLVGAGFLFAPVLHRVLHKFHWDTDS